ncbi:chitin synthase-domain-containing protein [Dactylonectria estremocensis]|uniref:Chitin synthase n=1 Tax=Dactylonectria estremocensis TaxID=1079267 RepID=A0A9P9J0C5_9HYPO|nr:chitin synthase-domain-containing protein [Dactylonectria estremocensis]
MSWNPYRSYSQAPQGLEDYSIPLSYPLHDLDRTSHETIEEDPREQHEGVCIIFDGLAATDPGALDILAAIGLFRHDLLRKSINGKPVSTHVFEYSSQLSITEHLEIGGPERSSIPGLDGLPAAPVQFILVLKNENCGKLNSYRWLYNSVSRILNPEVVVHLDTGTKIEPDAVLKVWHRFYNKKDLGGICGELQASLVLIPLRFRGQMGQPLEDTLLGDPTFTSAQTESSQKPWNLNPYLADDRVICFQVVSKANAKWIITHWNHLYKSGHNMVRLAAFHLQLFHSILALILAWVSLAAFLLTTFAINDIADDPPEDKPISGFPFGKATPVVNGVIQIICVAMILFQFILALGSRPKNHVVGYTVSFIIFGFIQAYMVMNLIYLTKRLVDFRVENDNGSNYAYINEYYTDLGSATIITARIAVFGVYFAVGLLSLDPWHLFTSYAQFLFVSSAYINILNIFAFSNVHDIPWGQKSKRQVLPIQEPPHSNSEAIYTDSTNNTQDIKARYEEVLARALAAEPVDKVKKASPLATSDSLMEFRTILLASYIFSNFFISNYISYLLRFAGSLYYYTQKYWSIWFRRSW